MNIYNKYANIKSKISTLLVQSTALQSEIINDLENKGQNQHKDSNGLFSLVERKQWSYSAKVTRMEKVLKEAKQIEEITGKARYDVKTGLMFKAS